MKLAVSAATAGLSMPITVLTASLPWAKAISGVSSSARAVLWAMVVVFKV